MRGEMEVSAVRSGICGKKITGEIKFQGSPLKPLWNRFRQSHWASPTTTRHVIAAIVALGLTSAGLSGCVELKVERDSATLQADTPPKSDSLTYNLSQTTITVTGTVTLNDCDSVIASAMLTPPDPPKDSVTPVQPPVLPPDAPPIDINENFTVSVASQADPKYQYQIPFKDLEGWTKQLNLAVARNPNKTLVSINGTITDQAGPTILAAAQAAIAIGGTIAVPEAAPVTAAAVAAKAGNAANSDQKLILSQLADHIVTSNALSPLLDLKSSKEKARWDEFFNQAALDSVKKAREDALKALQARKTTPYCSKDIHRALEQIAAQQRLIVKANSKSPDKNTPSKTPPDPGSAPAPTPPDPNVARAQARIAAISAENHLTRQFTATWTPSRDELALAARDKHLYIMTKQINIFEDLVSPYWLSDAGVALIKANRENKAVLANLQKPLVLQLFIRPWTVGRDYDEKTLDGKDGTAKPSDYRSGVVYRDPALSVLRTCLGICGGALKPQAAGTLPSTAIAPGVVTSEDLDNDLVETTGDVSGSIAVPIVQLGRLYVQPLRNVLFQTSVAALTVAADGSIASVGTQSSSAAAAGFTAATGAANAQASAIAAHNTAVGAQNTAGAAQTTATTAAATYADTVNKAIADCLTQQAAIVKAGGRPVACQ
jgi:hypothetical protein